MKKSIDVCSRCSGYLPAINGDTGHPDLPRTKGAKCDGGQPNPWCRAYRRASMGRWEKELQEFAEEKEWQSGEEVLEWRLEQLGKLPK